MRRFLRPLLLFVLLLAVAYQLAPARSQVRSQLRQAADRFDPRPEKRILFIGNSHTFYHDMPEMVRRMADSAGAEQKYVIRMHAPGSTQFIDHWRNPDVQALLAQKWDHVILQGGSNETMLPGNRRNFHEYGAKLAHRAWAHGNRPAFYVTWQYAADYPFVREHPYLVNQMYTLIQQHYAELAQRTGADTVNVGQAWERALSYRPAFPMYQDGNHATLHGSYLAALMFYQYFSNNDAAGVSYAPRGISAQEAALLKKAAR